MGLSGSLEKMNMVAYQKSNFSSSVGEMDVYINPDKYSQSYVIKYNDVRAQGSNGGSPDFNKMCGQTVNFELVFDGTGVVPNPIAGKPSATADGIAKQIEAFKNLVFSYNGNIHSPNFLKLSWGTFLFKCRLKSLSITFTLFKPDGTPLRARAKATFIGYTDEVELALQAKKSSPDLTHLRTVMAGDTLPLLCYQIYQDSSLYIQVAEFNGLTEFRRLVVGTRLVFPPLGTGPT